MKPELEIWIKRQKIVHKMADIALLMQQNIFDEEKLNDLEKQWHELKRQLDEKDEQKCEMCSKTGPKVRYRNYNMEPSTDELLCDDCFHETENDDVQMEREQREGW